MTTRARYWLRRMVARPAVGLAPLVITVAVAANLAAGADPRDDQERIDEEVAEASAALEHATERARAAAARYTEAEAALPAAQARLEQARGEVAATQAMAETAERSADRAADELAEADDRYDTAAGEVEQARDAVSNFSVAAYKGSRLAGATLLLSARDPGELGERLGYLDHVAGVEQAAVEDLVGARLSARQAKNQATIAHDRAERARAAAVVALDRAERAEREAEQAATEATELIDARDGALAVAEAERDESLSRYEEAERAAEQIADEVRAWEASQSTPEQQPPPPAAGGQGSGATLALPTEGWQSSAYGMRYDPFFEVWQMHEGVDIAAPGGAPIYAAADGTVIQANWNGGYGNYTCLGHGTHDGQGLSTCYAHQSEILVSDGQSVQRGDVIGRVGTTGASTGNHLHFEVRLDGSSTDPVPFLPGF